MTDLCSPGVLFSIPAAIVLGVFLCYSYHEIQECDHIPGRVFIFFTSSIVASIYVIGILGMLGVIG